MEDPLLKARKYKSVNSTLISEKVIFWDKSTDFFVSVSRQED